MKRCLECGEEFSGRSDKKFCSDSCRVAHNNRKYHNNYSQILEVNRILKRNYSILSEIYSVKGGKCNYKYLFKKGYNFDYLTSVEELYGNDGGLLLYCYDLSFSIDSCGIITIKKQ